MNSGGGYRWILRRGSRKDVCPACGKRRFVPYVAAADGITPAGAEFGRCDREQSCGYLRYPGGVDAPKVEMRKEPVRRPPLMIDPRVMCGDGVRQENSLLRVFGLRLPYLRETMDEYRCGTGGGGECVYYQYDGEWLRTAKMIMYGPDGHRLKGGDGRSLPVRWLHRSRAEWREGFELSQCLFGTHLLAKHPQRRVVLVEAEKTAVLMAAHQRGLGNTGDVFVACGGSQMLKGSCDLSYLKNREVVLVPDAGQFWNWSRTAEAHGWKCIDISTIVPEGMEGADIWDLIEDKILTEIL